MAFLLRIGYNLGFSIRETGQALDRLGCVIQGTAPFIEEGQLEKATSRAARAAQPQAEVKLQVSAADSISPSAVSRHRTLQNLFNKRPALGQGSFVAPSASLIGDVKLGNNSSVWYGSIVRGAHMLPAMHCQQIAHHACVDLKLFPKACMHHLDKCEHLPQTV